MKAKSHLRQRPKQSRSQETLDRILAGAIEMLKERRFDDVAVEEITSSVGLTKGAFYRRFKDKQSLLHHLNAQAFSQALRGWDEFLEPTRWVDLSLREFLESVIGRLLDVYERNEPLMRSFAYEARWGSDESIRLRARELNEHVETLFIAVVRQKEDEVGVPDLETGASFFLFSLRAVLTQAILMEPTGIDPHVPDRQTLQNQLASTLVRCLTG